MHIKQMVCVLLCRSGSVSGSVEGFSKQTDNIQSSMQVAMGFSRNITHYGFTDLDLFFVY